MSDKFIDHDKTMLDICVILPYPVPWDLKFLNFDVWNQARSILDLTTLNIFIWSKYYGQSILEPIIAELSLFWLFILGFKVQIARG